MGMTPEERAAKLATRHAGDFYHDGCIDEDDCVEAIRAAVAEEREVCANIALAIDSGRGNEKEIAAAIRERIETDAPRT